MSHQAVDILFICRQSGAGRQLAQETLDMALAFAAFDQKTQLLFLEDSIWQLIPGHEGKLALKALEALSIYDIELCAEAEALAQRGLSESDIPLDVKWISRQEMKPLLAHANRVIQL